MTRGRRTPYTAAGIRRCKCWRCGQPAQQQWSVCADGNVQRPICNRCDIALNALVLRWAGDPEWRSKVAAYRRTLMSRYPKKPAAPKKGAGKKKAAPAKAKPKAKKAAAKKVTPKTKARTMRVRKTTALGKSESGVQVEGWDHFERHADRTHADTERVIEGLAASSVSSVNFGATLTEAPVKPPSAWHRFRCAITGLFGERAD